MRYAWNRWERESYSVAATRILPDDVADFLRRPGQLAIIGTLSPGGFPHMTPVWYQYDQDELWVWARRRRQKCQNVSRQPLVGLYIQAVNDAHLGVSLQGTARLCSEALEERCTQIARRYVGEEALRIWVEHMLYGRNALLRIAPVWYARNGSSWNL
jgi:PPOX class probable F420-dependent enzyme